MANFLTIHIAYIALLTASIFAIVTDVRSRKIPNVIPISLAASALIFKAAHGPTDFLTAVAVLLAVLFVGTVAFSFHWLGGGDVKLLAAGCAFLPPSEGVYFLLFTAIGGGILALVTAAAKGTLRSTIAGAFTIVHGLQVDKDILIKPQSSTQLPYAIAISFGALSVMLMHVFNTTALRIS